MSAFLDNRPNFAPNQIVCLECEGVCLYAEVIQVVTVRQVCWVRPLMLVGNSLAVNGESQEPLPQDILWDLRGGADLLWPLSLFRVALDTEAIPLLMQLQALESSGKDAIAAHRELRDFVGKVWLAYPNAFEESKVRSEF